MESFRARFAGLCFFAAGAAGFSFWISFRFSFITQSVNTNLDTWKSGLDNRIKGDQKQQVTRIEVLNDTITGLVGHWKHHAVALQLQELIHELQQLED
eukprot:360874-Hanusia_phi.AAC.1